MKDNSSEFYKIRAVQLDLARRMEPIPFIEHFIDWIADAGFNTLFLYLEWRIRTAVFDPGSSEGYSADELRQIIGYAGRHGISVIPGLATLGHSELLLRHPEYRRFSELREGIPGRFGNTETQALCPSLPETKAFLADYLQQVAEIFCDSQWIHAGGDEVWDIACCSKCKAAAPDFASEELLYLNHLEFIRGELMKLDRKMMIWDDMFECYPDILPRLSRDIVLVHWQYNENACGCTGHFSNLNFQDWYEQYDRLGFRFLFAPTDSCWSNISTSSENIRKYHPLGGLLTSWEKRTALMYRYFPTVAAAGRLWTHGEQTPEEVLRTSLEEIFGNGDRNLLSALAAYLQQAGHFIQADLNQFTTFDFFGPDQKSARFWEWASAFFQSLPLKACSAEARLILEDICFDCRIKELLERSSLYAWNLLHHQRTEPLEALLTQLEAVARPYRNHLRKYRGESGTADFDQAVAGWRNSLLTLHRNMQDSGLLQLILGLDEFSTAPRLKIILNGQQIAAGTFKAQKSTLFEKFFFIPADSHPEVMELEANGFGRQKIAYLQAWTTSGHFIPGSSEAVRGTVSHPEAVLTPDALSTSLGTGEVQAGFRDRLVPASLHTLKVTMKKSF